MSSEKPLISSKVGGRTRFLPDRLQRQAGGGNSSFRFAPIYRDCLRARGLACTTWDLHFVIAQPPALQGAKLIGVASSRMKIDMVLTYERLGHG